MKTIKYNITALVFLLFATLVNAQQTDPVKKANESNEAKSDKDMVDDDIAEFLVKSADARMMDSREGKLATEKGTTSSIKEYGRLMVKDQAMLLKEIKILASKKNITLPSDISDKKEKGREELAKTSGKDFDEKFVKMMKLDHERDIKLFEKAVKSNDMEVSAFAQKFLPVIQSHLDKINAIDVATK